MRRSSTCIPNVTSSVTSLSLPRRVSAPTTSASGAPLHTPLHTPLRAPLRAPLHTPLPPLQERFADLLQAGELLDAHRLLHPTPDWNREATWRGTPGALQCTTSCMVSLMLDGCGATVTRGSLAAHLLFGPKILQCVSRQHVLSPRLAASRRISGAPPNPPEYGRYFGKGMRIDYVLIQWCVPTFLWSTRIHHNARIQRGADTFVYIRCPVVDTPAVTVTATITAKATATAIATALPLK